LRTTRFGNGAEKVRKITVTKPDAMAARKKDKEENETLDDLQQNEVERGSIRPLSKFEDEFGSSRTMLIRTAGALRVGRWPRELGSCDKGAGGNCGRRPTWVSSRRTSSSRRPTE
jgi:hypothetical protein